MRKFFKHDEHGVIFAVIESDTVQAGENTVEHNAISSDIGKTWTGSEIIETTTEVE